jgi:hypothetical protein
LLLRLLDAVIVGPFVPGSSIASGVVKVDGVLIAGLTSSPSAPPRCARSAWVQADPPR